MAQRAALPTSRMTYEEYVEFERTNDIKHEFVDGELFAMAGGERAHNQVSLNVGASLLVALRDQPCEIYSSDMRVRTPTNKGLYPDALVACGEPQFNEMEDELLNPVLVVEVLSDSTEAYDRGQKFEHYQAVESLREYVLVDPRRMHVDVYKRSRQSWERRSYERGQFVELESLNVRVSVDELYRKVQLEAGVT